MMDQSGLERTKNMELGKFSNCLTVKDLEASRAFYEKFGLTTTGGDASEGLLVLANGSAVIGIFQDMFEKNVMTFNPGWDSNSQPLISFTDVRDLQRSLKAQGITFETDTDETTTGPGYFIVEHPDGNPIYVDQHV